MPETKLSKRLPSRPEVESGSRKFLLETVLRFAVGALSNRFLLVRFLLDDDRLHSLSIKTMLREY